MTTHDFKPGEFEKKWQEKWEREKTFSPSLETAKKPYYNLMMFPYPSAEGLHVGNMYAFTGADVYARFNRMHGKDVLEPIGLDGFGIHSENYALKVGRHPKEQAKISQENFYRQLRSIGNSFDWERTLETYDPDYYRWTQWLFIKLFQAGLAYRKKAEVNFCPSCKTVLSDEQVIDGKCERCNSIVEKRDLEQWFFKITEYADRLLENIERLDWTEKVKIAQRNWIGKSVGAVLTFEVLDKSAKLEVFTTRPDTLFGATFVVISPEHPLASEIEDNEVKEYIKSVRSKSKENRLRSGESSAQGTSDEKEKTGVFSGLYAINPVNQQKLPIWIADYVLIGYGTGAIMAVPAHDTRDYAFAKKYNLEIKEVVIGGDISKEAYTGSGKLINSGDWNGWEVPQNINKVINWLQEKGLGKPESNFHLRDWLISRQRYWGPPIPMIFCESCSDSGKGERSEMPGWYSAPVNDLPVLLPDVEDWKPMGTGLSPLANHPEFYKAACPECGKAARRETDVSDTFLDSSWYFLGYVSNIITDKNKEPKDVKVDQEGFTPWDKNIEKSWLPVTQYIGGAEHSVLHLLYARFISMVLADLKLTHFEEPFSNFFAHGLIIKDGAKMSKSKGNVVVPDEYIHKYGADTLRAYLMFLGPFSEGGDFRDSGIEGMNRFIRRVWRLASECIEAGPAKGFPPASARSADASTARVSGSLSPSSPALSIMHKTIKKVTEDTEQFKYNTAIAGLMEWYNFLSEGGKKASQVEIETFLKLLAPFAPFMTEELWNRLGNEGSIHTGGWPEYNSKYLVADEVTIVIQVNGKRRGEVVMPSAQGKEQSAVESEARKVVTKYLESEPKKIIFVPGKVINFVV